MLSLIHISRDASDEEKIQYISQTYGVPREAIKISNGFFVFNNPDQEYDPTHIHPYAVRKEHVRIPLETGNPELDFINELYATAVSYTHLYRDAQYQRC